jgi:hypothetical protein
MKFIALGKNKIMLLSGTWMKLETTLSEVSQPNKNENHMVSLLWGSAGSG